MISNSIQYFVIESVYTYHVRELLMCIKNNLTRFWNLITKKIGSIRQSLSNKCFLDMQDMYLTTSQCVFVNISDTMNIRYGKTYCILLFNVSIEKKIHRPIFHILSGILSGLSTWSNTFYTTSPHRQNTLLFLIDKRDLEYISLKLSCNCEIETWNYRS